MKPPAPPRPARALLRRYCPPAWLEAVEGDLEERFARLASRQGRRRARVDYWKEVLLFCLWHAHRRGADRSTRPSPAMLKNYLAIVLRNARRYPAYSAINLAGLVIGLACCLLILLYVHDELRFDRFHAEGDRIHRVVLTLHSATEPEKHFAVTPATLAPVLREDFPEVQDAVRLRSTSKPVSVGDRHFTEERFFYADAAFFDVFSFPLLAGDAASALAEPRTLVLSESTARRYFGTTEAVGRALVVDDSTVYTVTGVMADVPPYSHFRPDLVASFSTFEPALGIGSNPWAWWNHAFYTYLLLRPDTDAGAFEARIRRLAEHHTAEQEEVLGMQLFFDLQPLAGIHLGPELRSDVSAGGDAETVYLLAVVALFVLLIACINFTNLSTARAMQRSREVGVRKALGASRPRLVGQFLFESVLLSAAATALALGAVHLVLPAFNAFTGKALALTYADPAWLTPALLGAAVLVGLGAGAYPALVLSAFQPVETLKGRLLRARRGDRFRKGLVVFQFTISIVLIVGTLVVFRQLDYMRSRQLGFDKEQIVVVPTRDGEAWAERMPTVKQEWRKHPGVQHVAMSSSVPGRRLNNITVQPEGFTEGQIRTMLTLAADPDFVETYGLSLAAGHSFDEAHPTDAAEGFLLNEAAVRDLGWPSAEAAVGRTFDWGLGKRGRIIGVLRDFHFSSLHEAVSPMVVHVHRPWMEYISVRFDPRQASSVLDFLQAQWRAASPDRPFDYFFLDEDFDRQYRADRQLGRIFGGFAGLAILIACLGLFGLASFTAAWRTKEIGIRKVLGASVPGLVLLLAREFAALVAVAVVAATPLAYLLLRRWLGGFAYPVEITWHPFAWAAVAALAVALLTVSYQAVRAAQADPVQTLRYE